MTMAFAGNGGKTTMEPTTDGSGIFGLIIVIVLFFVVLAVFRNVGAWLFKVNEVLQNQEQIIEELRKLNRDKPNRQ